jgi:L-galactose dehydrogenase/L-glyceraldehyde 3-phosphate reductase
VRVEVKYRRLGKTGLKVSEIGFGCGNIGGLIIRGTHEDQLNAVKKAVELGINYFDTAPGYGDGKSETHLGNVLAELNPEVVLATKVGLTPEDMRDVRGAVQQSVKKSLKRLRLGSVDVIQLHSRVAMMRGKAPWVGALSVNDVIGKNGVADAFDAIRSQGLTRFIGFTGIGEAAALHGIIDSSRFDVVQTYFNLLNPSAGWSVPNGFKGYDFKSFINKAAERGMGVAAIRVMAAGALGGVEARAGYASPTVSGPLVPNSEYEKDETAASSLSFLVSGEVKSLPQAALRFVLMHPAVSVALVGFSNRIQIEEAATYSGAGPLTESDLDRLRKIWANAPSHIYEI